MDGLFQAQALRSAGFNITDISLISPALQLLYMVIVYTAAFPVILSLRQSNVYEERSLGQTGSSKSGDHQDGRAQGSQLGVSLPHSLHSFSIPFTVCSVSDPYLAGAHPEPTRIRYLVPGLLYVPHRHHRTPPSYCPAPGLLSLQFDVRSCLRLRHCRYFSRPTQQ